MYEWIKIILLGYFTSILFHSTSFAQPTITLTPTQYELLAGEGDAWKTRAQAWYHQKDQASRRAQMRAVSRALKRGCFTCHNRGFKGYQSDYEISVQMMTISAEQHLQCKDCHLGKRKLSSLGTQGLIMWRYSVEQHVDCLDCHIKYNRFTQLNWRGQLMKYNELFYADLNRIAQSLQVPFAFNLTPSNQTQFNKLQSIFKSFCSLWSALLTNLCRR